MSNALPYSFAQSSNGLYYITLFRKRWKKEDPDFRDLTLEQARKKAGALNLLLLDDTQCPTNSTKDTAPPNSKVS